MGLKFKSLPFATALSSSASQPWVESLRGQAQTRSERYLSQLARGSFLTLWSYSNVYTDEGRTSGRGDGKELCDLLVVFGRHVILFSDKDCEYKRNAEPKVAWRRWYKRSIESSARQLAGAKSWIERFPHRLFLDRQCQHALPVTPPSDGELKIHLVAVARGAAAIAVEHWTSVAQELNSFAGLFDASDEPSSGSLMLCSGVEKEQHYDQPFQIGWPLGRHQFVHVFDEASLDVVLGVLDTVPDFVRYLEQKEAFFSAPGREIVAPGEEDLLAMYLESTKGEDRQPSFPQIDRAALVVLREGDWRKLVSDRSLRARTRANRISYQWDELIEFQTSHIVAGSCRTLYEDGANGTSERLLRKMAEEPRLTRRTLGAAVHHARNINKSGRRFSRTVLPTGNRARAYVIMSLPKPDDMAYEKYLKHRRYELSMLCEGCAAKFGRVDEVLGIAMEPYSAKTLSVDFALMTLRNKEQWHAAVPEVIRRLDERGLWNSRTTRGWLVHERELPVAQPRAKALVAAATSFVRSLTRGVLP
jgi:hypothetical protein